MVEYVKFWGDFRDIDRLLDRWFRGTGRERALWGAD